MGTRLYVRVNGYVPAGEQNVPRPEFGAAAAA